MNKPDWKDAPEWARFLAMDENGQWFWFEDEPKCIDDDYLWYPQGNGRFVGCWTVPDSREAWKDSLEQRPS
jgi:hypothetical protein